jgi:hypothetical protein
MNLTLSPKPPLNMDSTVIIIHTYNLSYTDMIIYGLFALLAFIALVVWIMSFKKGGN